MPRPAAALSFAVRPRVLLKHLGHFFLVLGTLIVVPASAAFLFGDHEIGLRYLAVLAAAGCGGALLSRLPAPADVQKNEGMVLAALIFLLAPLMMVYPMMGSGLSVMDAFFESVSAATTTGLSTAGGVTGKPETFLFGRAWMQWYGGLGIVVLALALTVQPGIAAKRLAVTEEVGEDLVGGTRAHARRVIKVYGFLTALGVLTAWPLTGDLFHALTYIFAAVSTGGFAPHAQSLGGIPNLAGQWLVTLFCAAGAVSLASYHRARHQGVATFFGDRQTQALGASLLTFSLALAGCLWLAGDLTPGEIVHHAPLLAFSAQTTAGFSSIDPAALDPAAKLVLIASMLVGGGIGSTAGGFKILRLLILLRIVYLMIVRTALPTHAVLYPRMEKRRLQEEEIREALCLILMFVMVIGLSWIPFLIGGYPPLDALFEVVSASCTVGLSAGISGPDLPAALKGLLCLDMLLGRLEIIAWIVIIFPRTWFGKHKGPA